MNDRRQKSFSQKIYPIHFVPRVNFLSFREPVVILCMGKAKIGNTISALSGNVISLWRKCQRPKRENT